MHHAGMNAVDQSRNPSAIGRGGYHHGTLVCQAPGGAVALQHTLYMNAGETGGNYEAGLEDQSGSSYFSSASKKQ